MLGSAATRQAEHRGMRATSGAQLKSERKPDLHDTSGEGVDPLEPKDARKGLHLGVRQELLGLDVLAPPGLG